MSIASTAVFNASHVLQFSYVFDNETQWMNGEFFNSRFDADQYVKQMISCWEPSQRVEGQGWRIVCANTWEVDE